MSELHDWLAGQHPGLRTYNSFQQKALELAASDAQHRALYRLFAVMVGGYIESFDEEPLPVEVAKQTYQRLLAIVGEAERSIGAPPSEQLAALNEVAAVELV